LAGVSCLLSCVAPMPPPGYLTQPFFQFTAGDGLCFRLLAVDGNGQGWSERYCDNPKTGLPTSSDIHQTRMVTAADLAQIQVAFDLFPAQPDPACDNNFLSDGTVTVLRRAQPGSDVSWTACVTSDHAALVAPYLNAVTLLQQFVGTP
jgi:hypothetical protein